MALTPEDVVNKRFQPTKFREGYDQDEVDDFLDEVVVELRRLGQENEELRQRMQAGGAQVAEVQHSQAPPMAAAEPMAPPAAPAAAPAAAEAAPAAYPGGDQSSDPNNTNNLLQLARRLHEEHVREGIEKRDALIAEGHATAARIVSEAEGEKLSHLSSLEQERVSLEGRIEDLRSFEREYRAKLKGHIEGLLNDLDSTASPVAAPTHQPQPVAEEPVGMQQDPAEFGAVPSQPQAGYPGFGGN